MADYRYLYLEIDGVLNTNYTVKSAKQLGSRLALDYYAVFVLENACKNSMSYGQKEGLRLVIVSEEGKLPSTRDAYRLAFSMSGLQIFDFISIPAQSENRSEAIRDHLIKSNEVIISNSRKDKISSVCFVRSSKKIEESFCFGNFEIQVDPSCGLVTANAVKLKEILFESDSAKPFNINKFLK